MAVAGDHIITVIVDENEYVTESDETNNKLSQNFDNIADNNPPILESTSISRTRPSRTKKGGDYRDPVSEWVGPPHSQQ